MPNPDAPVVTPEEARKLLDGIAQRVVTIPEFHWFEELAALRAYLLASPPVALRGPQNEDSARLDWLEAQGNGDPWVARESTTGRGYRLANSHRTPNFGTLREAIDAARGAVLPETAGGDWRADARVQKARVRFAEFVTDSFMPIRALRNGEEILARRGSELLDALCEAVALASLVPGAPARETKE